MSDGSKGSAATILAGETNADYHADKNWFSKSQLWDLASQGPQVFFAKHIAGTESYKGPSSAMSRGTHVHEYAEEGEKAFWRRVVLVPEEVLGASGRRTKATDEWETEQLKLNPRAILLKESEFRSYRAQFAAMEANPIYKELSQETIARETSIRWRDEGSGIPLKCRPDAITKDCIWDIKTTSDQAPLDTFWKSVVDYGYGMQAVHYSAGAIEAGYEVEKFVFLITSTVPPYSCHAVTLPERLIARARAHWRKAIDEVEARIELEHWLPADSGLITELFVPERYLEARNGSRSSNAWVQ